MSAPSVSASVDKKSKTRNLVLFSFFTVLIAIGAFIRIPVPFCPFTLQFLFTSLAGLLLGGRRGALAVTVYVALGLLGLPVFTSGGGPAYIFQPTFGYLPGFIAGTALTGFLAHRKNQPPIFSRLLLANFSGLLVVYFCGVVYLDLINTFFLGSPVALGSLLFYCVVLAIPGDLFLCFLAAYLGKKLYHLSI